MRRSSRISLKNQVDYSKYFPPKENLRRKRPAEGLGSKFFVLNFLFLIFFFCIVVKQEPDTWLIGLRHHVETVLSLR